jgi:flagellar basal-body rod protein FlgB
MATQCLTLFDLMESVGFSPGRAEKRTPLDMALVDSTQQLLEAAMRGSWQRQTAITNNIANADTPGYQPQEVSFESALQNALSSGESPEGMQFQTETKAAEPGPNGTGVSSDQESAKLAENGLDYQALTQVVGARNDIIRSALGAAPA